MADSKFLQYQDANGDGLIDVCGEFPEVNEEFCPGCIPNPCAITPIWQNRRKWEPFLNEKICKYQITKGTPRTTTGPEEETKQRSSADGVASARRETRGSESDTSFESGWLDEEPTSDPKDVPGDTPPEDLDPGQLESIAATDACPATDEKNGGIPSAIFDEYADEIALALLEAYNKDTSETARNTIKAYLEYTDWDLAPRAMSRLKLLYSVPYEVLQSIAEYVPPDEEEEVDTTDIEVSFKPGDLEIKLIRIRKGLDLYKRYLDVFRAIESSNILYLNPGDYGKPVVFNVENYGDRGWGRDASLMAKLWTNLKAHINNKGYFLDAAAFRSTKKKVGEIIFTFTYDYRIKKIVIYTVACPYDAIVVAGPEMAQRYEEFRDVTAMAYLARLVEMEIDLVARVPMEWTEFLVKYTFPEVYISTYPDDLYEESLAGSVAACVGESLLAEGKQLGEDILNTAFGLGDAIAYRFHEALCSNSAEDVKEWRETMGLKRGSHIPTAAEMQHLADAGGARPSNMTGEGVNSGMPDTVYDLAQVQAYEYVQANPTMFDFLCSWMGSAGKGPFLNKEYDLGLGPWRTEVGDVWDRLKLCGLLDMLAGVIRCLTGGLTLEEALASILKATLEGMSIDNFDKLFIGLSADQQAELDALVKENLESGDLFKDSNTDMAEASDGEIGNYVDGAEDLPDEAGIFSEERGWQGWDAFKESTLQGSTWENAKTEYDPSGYGGMTETEVTSQREQSQRTLAPSSDGGDSWTEAAAGDVSSLSESTVREAYAKALLENFKGKELELVDKLNTFPGAALIANIIATTACPRPPFMDPSFVDIIKDFELPWTCGRDFVWPEIAFKNPFYITMNWKDIMWILFQVATQVIKELLIAIVAKIFIKLCELLGTAICQTLELVGDVTAALATGNRTGLASVIKESICGPDVDDDTVNQTIVDLVALMGDAGAAMADSELVLEMVGGISSVATSDEVNKLVLGQDAGEATQVIATFLSYEYPQFPALHSETGVKSMFKNIGNLMPLDFKDNIKRLVDSTPVNEMVPANPTLCATPEQIEQFCELRATLMQDRASPEQIKKLCDRQGIKDNLEELVKPFQNFDNHVACNMPPLVSDPGCDNGILPFEPAESIAATTSVLGNQLEALKSDFSTDMLGNGPFMKNWGMMNMILSDTLASPLTVHQRKAANGWPSKNYVDFYTDDSAESEEVGSADGKIWRQRGAYPEFVAEWLQEQISNLTVSYNSNNDFLDDVKIVKDKDDYTRGGLRKAINILSLPDFGYNVEIDPAWEDGVVNFTKKARKGTPDFELLFEDNAKGMKTGPEGGQEGFSWGFQLQFYNADLIKDEPPEDVESMEGTWEEMQSYETSLYATESADEDTKTSLNVDTDSGTWDEMQSCETSLYAAGSEQSSGGATTAKIKNAVGLSRIKIYEFSNPETNLDVKLAALAIPSVRNVLKKVTEDKGEKVVVDLKYEFVSVDNTLDEISIETLEKYPAFMSMFETSVHNYTPPVILLHEMLNDSGAPFSQQEIKERYDAFMSDITNTIIAEVAANEPGFNYGADFDSLTWDEVEYVVDTGQTASPGGTSYGEAEIKDEDGNLRKLKNRDQILGISRMQWLIKNEEKEGENRIFYLDPIMYGGNYMSPPLYIKPLMNKGWLGFIDVLFPEMSPCKPQKSDLVDFGQIQDKMDEVYPSVPQDERLQQHPDCAVEWPYGRILERSAVAGLQGLIMAAVRIYASAHFIKSMATFTKFSPKFPEVFSSLYASYVVENMEESFRDASESNLTGARADNPRDDKFWYGFLEQSVQMYARRLEDEDIEAPPHVVRALTRLNDMMENYDRPSVADREEDYGLHETKRRFFQLKKYRYDKILEAVKATEEDAKLVLKELVIEQLNYMGEKFISNLDVVEMVPDVFDLDYYLLENFTQGCDNLDIDHEIKYTYPNLPAEPEPDDIPYYTAGAEFVVAEDLDLENGFYSGQEYVGEYVVHIDDEGTSVFLAGPTDLGEGVYTNPDTGTEEYGYQQDILAPLVNQTSIDIGDVVEYESTVPQPGDTRPFGLEKYIKIDGVKMKPSLATYQISSNEDLTQNISDVYPGPEGNELRFVEDEDGNVVGVEGELGVRYGLMFSMAIDGVKYEMTSVEVDALDLPLSEFKTLEANSKLLWCLINLLKEDDKFKLICRYIFPLSKITATTAIYNDMAFLSSIGEVTVKKGATWAWVSSNLEGSTNDKPGRYVDINTAEKNGNTYVESVDVYGNPGWAAYEDRDRPTIFKTYDQWDRDLLTKSKRQIKRLFKSYYNSRDFATFGKGESPGKAFMAELKGRMSPRPGERLMPWWKRRKLRSNPFNADGEPCENED